MQIRMDLRLLIRVRWRWLIKISGGRIPYALTHIIFRTSSPHGNDNFIPNKVLLILKLKLIPNVTLNLSRCHVPFYACVNAHLALTVSRHLP
jgi:hypothetical protein